MAESPVLEIEDRGHVRVLHLNRPDHLNALSSPLLKELSDCLAEVEALSKIRVLVITGVGRAFSAGADIVEESDLSLGHDDLWSLAVHKVITAIHALRVPTIAAINGLAVGAGLDLALACSMRIVADSAWVSSGYVNIGYSPDAGGTYFLPRIVGEAHAAEMIFTGQRVTALTAAAWGLVSRVVAADELLETACELAEQIASGPPIAVELAKRLLSGNADVSLETALRNELVAGRICGASEDHAEGLQAISERRQPKFRGR